MWAALKITFIAICLLGSMAWALYAVACVASARHHVRRGSHCVGGVYLQ